MTRWLETDTYSNKDISTAVSVGVYTADADRLILVQVFADSVVGNGDYELYVTHQINGSGSSYRMIPITTAAAASGVTAIAAQSGMIAVRSGDVLTVYLDGLAGDNSTPDTTVRWFELAALQPTTPDRKADVAADGTVGIDWSNVGSQTTTVNLSGTTIKTATDVETDTADIQTQIGTAGAGLTAVPWNAAWDAEVQSEATDALNAYDPPTKAELDAGLAALNDLDAAGVRAAIGLAAANLDTQLDALPTAAEAASQVRTELATELAHLDEDVSAGAHAGDAMTLADDAITAAKYDQTTAHPLAQADAGTTTVARKGTGDHTLETVSAQIDGIEAGTGLTAQEIANAVHNLAPAGTPAAGSIGDKLNDMPATILTTAVAAYATTPGTFGYLLSLLAGLDFTQVNLVTASNAGEITIKRTLNLVAVVSGLTIPADWTACYWTVKRSTDDLDADALVQILVSNPADPDDGVQVLMGTALEDESDGSLVVNQGLGTVTIALGDASTALLEDAVELVWDAKVHAPAGKTQPGAGTATITTAVTRA